MHSYPFGISDRVRPEFALDQMTNDDASAAGLRLVHEEVRRHQLQRDPTLELVSALEARTTTAVRVRWTTSVRALT
jgi:hypothetical protein